MTLTVYPGGGKAPYRGSSTTCVARSSPGFWEYLMRSDRPKQYCRAL